MIVRRKNINYWLHSAKILASDIFVPGFVRYEVDINGTAYCTDLTSAVNHKKISTRSYPNGYVQDKTSEFGKIRIDQMFHPAGTIASA